MPLLDIAISQPCSCFQNNLLAFRSENKLVIGNDKGLGLGFASISSWRSICITDKLVRKRSFGEFEVWRSGLRINAVATLEFPSVTRKNKGINGHHQNVLKKEEPQSSSEVSAEVDDREQLRRMRISRANKGNTPWNLGKKHSPETLKKIKERTRLAMQDPKVKMKLVNLGHSQTDETRTKIGVGVRLGWEKRRQKIRLQETCHYEWQNLIALASRKGLLGEEELQWNSFKILNKQLEKEWLQSVEQRKNELMLKPKGSRRAPKSAEQKRKISAAIAAKWTEPEYRGRVCNALAKFHGIPEGVQRRPRRKPSGDGETRRSQRKKNEVNDIAKPENKNQILPVRLKKSITPYKDPLADSKLEMIKSIRAKRATPTNKKTEAIAQARLLIAEAEKAAEGLVIASENNPLAQASLVESRMLIAEAIQFIEALEKADPLCFENDNDSPEISTKPITSIEEKFDAETPSMDFAKHKKVNGVHSLSAIGIENGNFSFVSDLVKGNASNSSHNGILETKEDLKEISPNGFHSPELDNTTELFGFTMNPDASEECVEKQLVEVKQRNVIKKWVRGRLVEVEEES